MANKKLSEELKDLSPWKVGLVVLLVLYAANWKAVEYGYSPFLYCWLRPIGNMFVGWLNLAALAALVWFAVAAYSRKAKNIIPATVTCVLAYGLPTYLDSALRLGGSCS